MIAADRIRTVCVVGTGAIGASWTALVLSRGLEVVATDPAEGASEALTDIVSARLAELGAADAGWQDRLTFEPDLGRAVTDSDLVLENGPERLEVKRDIFAALDEAAGPDVLLASSSSGLLPSSFQSACRRAPERVLVAHPFNPPHLLPLVEVVGGEQTSEEAVESAMQVMRRLGKRPIRIRRELPGHVANRLQAALWREAYHLVDQGVVSAADLDAAIASGPGLRWALLGPLATQHLSGGPGGLAHVLDHLGPPMADWWADLGQPELTPALVETLVAAVDDEFEGTSADDVRSRRDRALLDLMALKGRNGLD